jgi:hypothetical protein
MFTPLRSDLQLMCRPAIDIQRKGDQNYNDDLLVSLKGQSHQILDYILGSKNSNKYVLQDRLRFSHFLTS